jgi:hypothetical protein
VNLEEIAMELAESFVNGNRQYVRDEILNTYSKLEAIKLILLITGNLERGERASFKLMFLLYEE